MKRLLTIALLCISAMAYGQQRVSIREARYTGVQFLQMPPKGILRVEVSEEYSNVVLVFLCGFRGSVPLACRENYNITMTTAKGRVVTITDYMDKSFGVISPNEFPLTVDANVMGLNGEETYPFHFSVKLMYKGFCYRIYLYDEWTRVEGGIH